MSVRRMAAKIFPLTRADYDTAYRQIRYEGISASLSVFQYYMRNDVENKPYLDTLVADLVRKSFHEDMAGRTHSSILRTNAGETLELSTHELSQYLDVILQTNDMAVYPGQDFISCSECIFCNRRESRPLIALYPMLKDVWLRLDPKNFVHGKHFQSTNRLPITKYNQHSICPQCYNPCVQCDLYPDFSTDYENALTMFYTARLCLACGMHAPVKILRPKLNRMELRTYNKKLSALRGGIKQ